MTLKKIVRVSTYNKNLGRKNETDLFNFSSFKPKKEEKKCCSMRLRNVKKCHKYLLDFRERKHMRRGFWQIYDQSILRKQKISVDHEKKIVKKQ